MADISTKHNSSSYVEYSYKSPIQPSSGKTFQVSDTTLEDKYPPQPTTIRSHIDEEYQKLSSGARVLITSEPGQTYGPDLNNGFVGSALRAYNQHYHLVLSPDSVWITILTSLTRFIDANAEEMRGTFVNHTGKKELSVYGGGNILSANYIQLIEAMADQIGLNTKEDVKNWAECSFSTSNTVSKLVSRVVLMGAMKNYFSYKIGLLCGLPKVTLEGTQEDWKMIGERVEKMGKWHPTLKSWQEVLSHTLSYFINAFDQPIDKDFWNRIAHIKGGGSGPRYLQGWILSFIGFSETGKYLLESLSTIQSEHNYGKLDTNDVPSAMVEVPVSIDDNGRDYKVKFVAGCILSRIDQGVIRPSVDWALVDVTDVEKRSDSLC